jgi:hypothetical protein
MKAEPEQGYQATVTQALVVDQGTRYSKLKVQALSTVLSGAFPLFLLFSLFFSLSEAHSDFNYFFLAQKKNAV